MARKDPAQASRSVTDEGGHAVWSARLNTFKQRLGVRSLVGEVAEALSLLETVTLVRWLQEERPAVQAVLLCLAPQSSKAMMLGSLSESARTELLLTLGGMQAVLDAALEAVAEEATARLVRHSRKGVPFGGQAWGRVGAPETSHAAFLLQGLEPGFADTILEGLALKNAPLAASLRNELLTVPKLGELFLADRRALLSTLSEAELCLFLYGTRRKHGEPLVQAFFEVFSKAKKQDLEERMACLGKVREADLNTLFRKTIETAMAMRAQGKIAFPWEEQWVS